MEDLVFTKREAKRLAYPYYDDLVVTFQIANTKMCKILMATRVW